MNDELSIKELYKEYWNYMIRKDIVAAVYGGGKNRWFLRGDFTLRKETDTWKLTSSKASTY